MACRGSNPVQSARHMPEVNALSNLVTSSSSVLMKTIMQGVEKVKNHFNNCSLKVAIEFTCTESWTAYQLVPDFFNTQFFEHSKDKILYN